MGRNATTDDRGRPIRLYDFFGDLPHLGAGATVPRDVHARLETRLGISRKAASARWCVAGGAVGLALSFIVPASFSPTARGGTTQIAVFVGALAIATALIILARLAWNRSRFAPRLIGAMLAERRCPACGYDLAGAKAGSDGFTTCPECGAAWSMVR